MAGPIALRRAVTTILAQQTAAQGGATRVSSRELVPMRQEIAHPSELSTPQQIANVIHMALRHVDETTQGARSLPVLGGVYWPNVSLAAGVATRFSHGCGAGITVSLIPCRVRLTAAGQPPVIVEVGQDVNGGITLASSVACLVDLWFFPQPGVTASGTGLGASAPFNLPALAIASRGYYGDGNDGVGTFDGSATPAGVTKNSSTLYTANRDLYYTSATIASGVTLAMAGWRLFVNGTLSGAGTIANNGTAGTNGSGAAGGAGAPVAYFGVAVHSGGAAGTGTGAGNLGGSGTNTPWGGAGGAGHAGGTGGAGAGGTTSGVTTLVRPAQDPDIVNGYYAAKTTGSGNPPTALTIDGGAGGGGGGGGSTGAPGSGGGGGGIVGVYARIVSGSVSITAAGGAGGNGNLLGGAGGGGGGGVVLFLHSDTTAWTGTATAAGGAAGTGGNGAGVAGSNGTVFTVAA